MPEWRYALVTLHEAFDRRFGWVLERLLDAPPRRRKWLVGVPKEDPR